MVIYEVSLQVKNEIKADFLVWLEKYIKEMLQFNGFEKAQTFEQIDYKTVNFISLVVHYHLTEKKYLDEYFTKHAKKMRDEGLSLFGQHFSAERRILVKK